MKYKSCWYIISLKDERTKGLTHLCKEDGIETLCGRKLSKRWYLGKRIITFCVRCLKREKKLEKGK